MKFYCKSREHARTMVKSKTNWKVVDCKGQKTPNNRRWAAEKVKA